MAKYIPEQHYVAWHNFAEKNALAFMTVYGTDAAAKKRMATVDQWVSGHRKVTIANVKQILDNKPLTGFEIDKEVRRWTTSNVVWRIVDPRGFTLEISSGNMAYLLGNCTIKHGVIEDELIWVRDGKDNYLLPTASEEYATYTRNTKAKASTTKISDVKVGDRISLATGEHGIYLGKYSCVRLGSYYGSGQEIIKVERYHIMRDESNVEQPRYIARKTFKDIIIDEVGAAEDKDYSDEITENVKRLDSSMRVHYVCQHKFNINETLATIKEIPYVFGPDDHEYFIFRNGTLFKCYRRNDSWQGSMRSYSFNPSQNNCHYTNADSISIVKEKSKSAWSLSINREILIEDIAQYPKFNYTVTINGKDYQLHLG